VVDGADSISVTLNDKRNFKGKVIGKDASTDIALIKIEADNLQPVSFGDSEQIKVGEWVLAVGNPFDLTSTVTAGIVSAKGRSIMTGESTRDKVVSYIQTDAAVNMGNSGGALVNTRGELIGINTAIYSQTGDFAGYSFAVPINLAARVVADLKQYGSLQRAMLGITMLNPEEVNDDPKIKVLEGACVVDFAMRSPAKEAGIEKGDVVIAVNGTKVTSKSNLQEQIMKFHVGDKVKVKVDRYGTEKEFTVELRNAQGNMEIIKSGVKSAEILGAAFKSLGEKEKSDHGISYGIEVSNITKGKIRESGMQNGFIIMIVNDQKIQTPEEFYEIVDKILNGKTEEKDLLITGFNPKTGATRRYVIDLND
jgi:S1-C subfamily serine protease